MAAPGGAPPSVIDISAPGTKIPEEDARPLRAQVADILRRDQRGFPGAQPVSFSRRHLEELMRQDYYVCEKSDGQRYLLFLTSDPTDPSRELAFLIDRRNDYWYVPGLHFPPPGPDITAFHTSTLIDGELVLDAQPPGSPVPFIAKYLVFDCLALDNQLLMQRTLDKRIAYFKERVYAPYKALYKAYPEEAAYLPFRVELKEMQFGYAAELMFRNVLPNLPHGSDGLIFTARSTEYKTGTDQNILKWKREEENSVDFEWVFDWETKETAEGERLVDFDALPVINLFVWMGDGKASKWYGTLHLEPQEWADLKALGEPLDERIVECYMDAQKRWRFMRFRDDKDHANHVSTVESVIESIRDAVSEKELIAVAPEVRRRWKAREQVEKERQGRK